MLQTFLLAFSFTTFVSSRSVWEKQDKVKEVLPSLDQITFGHKIPDNLALEEQALYSPGGDMILPPDFLKGAGIRDFKYRWFGFPGHGRVPFVIDPELEEHSSLIYRGMEQFMMYTCVNFIARANTTDYVKIYKGNGCWADVGRKGGEQKISLGNGCHNIGTIVHLLAHAVGLLHEHQRSDRDQFINIFYQNIAKGNESQFDRILPNQELSLTPFDIDSIMMLGNYAFSKRPQQLMTIQALDRKPIPDPSQKKGLNQRDILQINQMYKCGS